MVPYTLVLPSVGAGDLFACAFLMLSPGARWFCDGSSTLTAAERTSSKNCKLVCRTCIRSLEDGAKPGRRGAHSCRGSFLVESLRQDGLSQRKESVRLAGLNPLWLFPCNRVLDEVSLADVTRELQPVFFFFFC